MHRTLKSVSSHILYCCSDSEEEDEEGMERRRDVMRERARRKAMDDDILDVQDEEESDIEEVGPTSCDYHVYLTETKFTSCPTACMRSEGYSAWSFCECVCQWLF